MSKSLLAAVAALAVGALAGQAFADEALKPPTEPVVTAGVDFRNEAAVRAFYNRIEIAAHRVCDSNSANPRVTQKDAQCVRQAVAQAVQTADRPLLTALYSTSGQATATR